MVVNQTFAKQYFPNENPVGKRFTFDTTKPDEVEIVGLARDAKYTRQRDEIPPTVYVALAAGAALDERRDLRGAHAGDPTPPSPPSARPCVRWTRTCRSTTSRRKIEQADETLRMERLFAKLLTLFGLLAQQLAVHRSVRRDGLRGLAAHARNRHSHGARRDRGDVLKMILRQGMTLALLGVVLGLAGAYVLTKYLESRMDLSQHALRRQGHRPADLRRDRGAADMWRWWPATSRRGGRRRWIRWWRCDTSEEFRISDFGFRILS